MIRAFSYGGGVQSTAALVLAVRGEIEFPTFLFSNVGDDSEYPKTIAYVREVAVPFAVKHGIELVELNRRKRDGTVETLWGRLMQEGSRSIPIPVRMSNTGAPGSRSCTADFKIRVIGAELRRRGASPDTPATVGIGISTDEIQRASNRRVSPWEVVEYPLIDLGLDRAACMETIRRAGLEVPPKSSCFFCPFHGRSVWEEMRRDEPALFGKAVELERTLNIRRSSLACHGAGAPPAEAFQKVFREGPDLELLVEEDGYFDDDELYDVLETEWPHDKGTCPRCSQQIDVADGVLVPHGKDPVYLTRYGKPLDEAMGEAQTSLFPEGPESCDSGYCFT